MRPKVAKFGKNYRLNVLILLARDEQILLFPLKMIQRGDHWMIFHIIFQEKIYNFASLSPISHLFSTEYNYFTSPGHIKFYIKAFQQACVIVRFRPIVIVKVKCKADSDR